MASRLAREPILVVCALVALALAVLDPRTLEEHVAWLDAPSLVALLALLVTAQGIRESGYVERIALALARRAGTERRLALGMVLLSAALSSVLTNDVCLFLVVPLTLALSERSEISRARLVTFEALAVNAGSALSPIGNPQNLVLWRRSGLAFFDYVAALALPMGLVLVLLLALTALSFRATPIVVREADAPPLPALERGLGVLSVAVLVGLVVGLQVELRYAAPFAAVALLGLRRPGLVARIDGMLLATIASMLLALGHLAHLPSLASLGPALASAGPLTTLGLGLGLSQLISNVPAAVALQHLAPDTVLLAVAVNVGGFGLAIGSLANVIALRLEGSRETWRVFHRFSIPFLAAGGVVAAAWAFLR